MAKSREPDVQNWIFKNQNVEENQSYKFANGINCLGVTKPDLCYIHIYIYIYILQKKAPGASFYKM